MNIAFLVAVGIERWLLRHEVSAAVVAKDIAAMKVDIEDLHEKASNYSKSQQTAIGKASIDIAVLKSEVVGLKQEIEILRGGGQPSHSRRS